MTVISPWLLSVLCNVVAYQIKIASIIPVLNKKTLPRADCLRHSFKKLFLICYLDWLKEEKPVSLINSNLATEETTWLLKLPLICLNGKSTAWLQPFTPLIMTFLLIVFDKHFRIDINCIASFVPHVCGVPQGSKPGLILLSL